MDELVRLCLVSSVMPRIKLGDVETRGQINVLLVFPFGSGKTTLLTEIQKRELGVKLKHWTRVSVTGTITRSGQVVPPSTIIGAGKTILIDEFHAIHPELRIHLLALMEEQETERSLGFKIPADANPPIVINEKYWSMYAELGYLRFRIQASYLVSTAYYVPHSPIDRMLLSRTIQVWGQLRYADLNVPLINYKMLDKIAEERRAIEEYYEDKQPEVSSSEYEEILEFVMDYCKKNEVSPEYVRRLVGDVIRVMKIYEALGENTDKAYDLVPIIVAGIKRTYLTPIDLRVLFAIYSGIRSESELERVLGFNDETHESIDKLKSLGLITRRGYGWRIRR